MLTEPGAKRTLYYDVSVIEGITTNRPITPMTMDWTLSALGDSMAEPYIGKLALSSNGNPKTDLMFGKGVRIYMNFSQIFFLMSPKTIAKSVREVDENMYQTLNNLDVDLYTAEEKFPYLKLTQLVPFAFRSLLRSRKAVFEWLEELIDPVKFNQQKYLPQADKTLDIIARLDDFNGSLSDYLEQTNPLVGEYTELFMPLVSSYIQHLGAISTMFEESSEHIKNLADKLTMGIEGDESR